MSELLASAPTQGRVVFDVPTARERSSFFVIEAQDRLRAAPPGRAQFVEPDIYATMYDAFEDLSRRALWPNPFMAPPATLASCRLAPGRAMILAVSDAAEPGRLLGVWALRQVRDPWSLGMAALQAPVLPTYEALASPVLDRERACEAFAAMLGLVEASGLPRAIRVASWPRALDAVVPEGVALTAAETWERAMLAPQGPVHAEAYLRAALRKGLNKRNNRQAELAAGGALAIDALRGEAALAGFEQFVALESRGWKGEAGTAMALRPADLAYMREAVQGFAAADRLSVDRLLLDGAPIAVGVVIEAGGSSLFWKAAYDEAHARHAPGALLHLAVTRRLFAEGRPSLDCGMGDHTTPAMLPWSERAAMASVTLDLGGGLAGRSLRAGAVLRQRLRRWKHGRG